MWGPLLLHLRRSGPLPPHGNSLREEKGDFFVAKRAYEKSQQHKKRQEPRWIFGMNQLFFKSAAAPAAALSTMGEEVRGVGGGDEPPKQ